ncbi:MAG TPA: hypothetical protein VMU51_38380 [Mycobacteriales bacterium]|nr:hypothetical protein [Mycobacteriales bacterium]
MNRTVGTGTLLAAVALAVAVLLVGGSVALAGGTGPAAGRQPAAPVLLTTPPTTSPPGGPGVLPNRTIWEFIGTQNATAWNTGSPHWVDLPGATATFNPLAIGTVTFNAVFSGETLCTGAATTWCSYRVVVQSAAGTSELKPAAGTDFVLATAGAPVGNQSVQRTSQSFPGGAGYTIKAQFAVVGTGTVVTVDDWNFTVTMIT